MLEIQSLSVGYPNHEVLRDISITIQSGEILVVVGPNGVGKSTLIRAVSGINLSTLRAGAGGWARRDAPVCAAARPLYGSGAASARAAGAFTVYQTVLLGRTPYLSWLGKAGTRDHAHGEPIAGAN